MASTQKPHPKRTAIALTAALLFIALLIALAIGARGGHRGHDPRDLSYWSQIGTNQDWTLAARGGDARTQFFVGIALIRTNLQTAIDRVPQLSTLPIVGKRWFEHVSYSLDNRISVPQLEEAYRWIEMSAAQGYPPAQEAKKLLQGRIEASAH